jgi:3-oxoacyl-[acyl-carrier protein] reductase
MMGEEAHDMDLRFEGRRVLITGSSSGIGASTARMLAQEGCKVVVHGRDRERCETIAADIGASGIAVGELSTDDGAASVYEQATAALGGSIDILVNNAGGSSTGNSARAPLDISADDWMQNYSANNVSAVRMNRLAVPGMVSAGWGRVIQVSSAVAVQPNNLGADYSGAKAAMNNYTVSLAGSLKGVGVTVNTVTPGIILGEGFARAARKRYGDDSLSIDEITRRMVEENIFELPPAGRLGAPEEVAIVICMLASPLSGFVTGANYRVDGGLIRSVN